MYPFVDEEEKNISREHEIGGKKKWSKKKLKQQKCRYKGRNSSKQVKTRRKANTEDQNDDVHSSTIF